MKRIVLSGCNGNMGRVITKCARERDDFTIVAGFDRSPEIAQDYPVLSDPLKFHGQADVLIDFSHPSFFPQIMAFIQKFDIPAVIATTGLNKAQLDEMKAVSEQTPIFFSANMSLGINLIVELAKKAASVLSECYDIEIIEMHHNQKVDAPSGTALMIADNISSVLDQKPQYVYDRHSQRKKRERNEIGLHAIRGGTIVGEHEIVFAGKDELITIKHASMSRQVFASGAFDAANFIVGQKPGLYNMSSLVTGCR
jgi:4-hydroxy-tetrahydrodipicolinate reductase